MALTGIIRAPVSACETNCVCHEELGMLRKQMRKQGTLNEKKIDYSPRSRYSVEQWEAGEKKSFERYAGEMVYLKRMMRDCEITKMEKRTQKEEGERKRKGNDKAKIEEEIVKRIETAKEEWVKQMERDKDDVE